MPFSPTFGSPPLDEARMTMPGAGNLVLPPGMTEEDLLVQAKQDWRRTYTHWRKWRVDAKEDFNFRAGNQWHDEDKLALDRQNRPAVTFNRCGTLIDAIGGAEVQNRQEVTYIPRSIGLSSINEALTAAAKYFRDQCNAEDEESDAFLDCVTCGVGWTETRLDFDDDPDGKLVIERVDPFEVFADPSATKANMPDAGFIFRVKDLTKDELEEAWPGASETIMPGAFQWGDIEEHEDQPHETIHGRQYEFGKGRPGQWRRKKYRVVEYQWKEFKPVYRMIDSATGQDVTFDQRRWSVLQRAMKKMGGEIPDGAFIKQKRLETQRAYFLGDTILEVGKAPYPLGFTYKAITGKRDRNNGTWYGIMRAMKDPQRWSNKFFSQILHIINTGAKGGLLAERDAFDDTRDAETRWAEADSIMWMRTGGINKVTPKPLSPVPPDIGTMLQFCIQSLRDVTGINLELLGQAEQVQPGVLEYQRRQSGLMILATLFDSLRRYRKEQGRLLLYFIEQYIPEGKLVKIEGPQGSQYVPLMKQPEVLEYDVIVDEAPSSPNLKEQVFGVLQVLAPQLVQLGIQIPIEALDYLPLPDSLVQAMKQANGPTNPDGSQKQPQVDPATQAMQQQIQLEQMKAQSDAQLAQQKFQSDSSLKQQQMQADHALQIQRLQMDRQRADVDAQVAAAQLQLDQLKTQMMINKTLPGATPQLEDSLGQLTQTVAQNHQNVQNGLKAVADHVNNQLGAVANQFQAHQRRQDQLAQQMQDVMAKVTAPREIVRDEMGRVKGSRIMNGATA